MIDFQDILNNPEKYQPKPISNRIQSIKVGDKVRCYDQDSDDLNNFVGYGIVEDLYLGNVAWCTHPKTEDQPALNYQYYILPI